MSYTLRYDIGRAAYVEILRCGGDAVLVETLGIEQVSRWGGVYRNRHIAMTFAIKLPKQISEALQLLQIVNSAAKTTDDGIAKLSLQVLRRKLYLGTGLPGLDVITKDDEAFLVKIRENPTDLANWSAYADWLMEHPAEVSDLPYWKRFGNRSDVIPDPHLRGRVIAGWLDAKAQKVKYGVPLILTDDR